MFSELCDQFWSRGAPVEASSAVLPASDLKKKPVPTTNNVYPSFPARVSREEEECTTVEKVRKIANPVIKTLGLILLFGTVSVLKTYSLIDPVITTELTRLIFLCVLALILQKTSNTVDGYRNQIVGAYVYV